MPPPQKKARTSSGKASSHGGANAASDVKLEVVHQLKLTDLPTSLLVANIFPYLESRSDWNNFSLVNRDIHDSIESHDALILPWPENCALSVPRVDCDLECPIWSPDGRNIACSDLYRIHIFDQCRGHIKDWEAHDGRTTSLMYSPDGRLLVSRGYEGHVKIWDCSKEYQCTQNWQWGDRGSGGVAFSPDSKLVAVVTRKMATLLRVTDGSAVNSCRLAMGRVRNVLFTPDGHSVIFGGLGYRGGVLKVWRIDRDRDNLISVDIDFAPVLGMAMSADGSSIASAGDDDIKLWKLADEGLECIRTLEGPGDYSYPSVSFTNDDNFLVVGDKFGCIRFWKVEDGTCSRVYETTGVIEALKYSPDGSRLLVQYDKVVHLKSLCPVQNKEEDPKSDEDSKEA